MMSPTIGTSCDYKEVVQNGSAASLQAASPASKN